MLALAVAIVVLGVAGLPLGYLVVRATATGLDNALALLLRPHTGMLLLRSVALAGAVTATCLILGTALAWLVVRTDLPGRRVWQVGLGLPLALPSYVAAWSWIALAPNLAGFAGAYLVLISVSYPYVYLSALAALRRTNPDAEAVARTLGLGPGETFLRVVVPQLRPALAGGALLAGLYALSDFGAVATMRAEVLTTRIYRSYQSSFDVTPAAVLATLLAGVAIVVVAAEQLTRRRGVALAGQPPRRQPIVRLGRWRWAAVLAPIATLALSFGAPALAIVDWLGRGVTTIQPAEFAPAIGNSLLVSALGALAVIAVAFPLAMLSVRSPNWLSSTAESAAYAGHALPGIVVGLAVVFFGIRFVPQLYQQLPMLIAAYLVLFLAFGLGSCRSAVAQAPKALEDVARSLGRTRIHAIFSTTVRIATPGIAIAAALVFLTVLKELPATLLLRPTGLDTLATGLWREITALNYAEAAPYAVAIVLVAAIPTALLAGLGERRLRA